MNFRRVKRDLAIAADTRCGEDFGVPIAIARELDALDRGSALTGAPGVGGTKGYSYEISSDTLYNR